MPLLLGFALSSIIAGIAFWRGSLSASGAMGAVIIGAVTFGLGGWTWGLLLVLFFVTSSALSRFREAGATSGRSWRTVACQPVLLSPIP